MKRRINPLVDCVFKDLFGAVEHVDLLTHFLNAVVAPAEPFVDVLIDNPFLPAETPTDDYRVVDVRARDALGRVVQIEVQLYLHPHLRERILYGWADHYQSQLQRGGSWSALRPVIAVWILDRDLLRGEARWHNRFRLANTAGGDALSDHIELHTLELPKLRPDAIQGLDAAARWAYFLKEARHWDALPSTLSTPELRKAMSIIQRWSEKDEDYRAYQARMNALRIKAEMEAAQRELEADRERLQDEIVAANDEKSRIEAEKSRIEAEKSRIEAEKAQAEAEKAQALLEAERLRTLLRAAGLDPGPPPGG